MVQHIVCAGGTILAYSNAAAGVAPISVGDSPMKKLPVALQCALILSILAPIGTTASFAVAQTKTAMNTSEKARGEAGAKKP